MFLAHLWAGSVQHNSFSGPRRCYSVGRVSGHLLVRLALGSVQSLLMLASIASLISLPMTINELRGIAAVTIEDVTTLVLDVFCSGRYSDVLHLSPLEDIPAEVMLQNLLYRFPASTQEGERVALLIFVNPGKLGGEFWTQEVRSLIRFNGYKHPALPRIRDGGTRTYEGTGTAIHDFAYVITDLWEHTLETAGAIDVIRRNLPSTARQLGVLAHALSILHADGLLHRNLWAQAVEAQRRSPAGPIELRLSRFEMSTFQANLIRRSFRSEDVLARDAVTWFVNQGPRALVAASPERLLAIFRPGKSPVYPETHDGDIYSLGVLAFEWFVGDIEARLVELAFPQESTAPGERQWGYSESGWRRLHGWMLEAIREANRLPVRLRDLLARMLSELPPRPTASQIFAELTENQEAIALGLGESIATDPHLIAVVPKEFDDTALRWGWITQSASTPEGLAELQAFIQEDLRGGVLEYVEDGWTAVSNQRGPGPASARFVLRGGRGAYFSQVFRHHSAFDDSDTGTELPQVLIIKYVLNHGAGMARNYRRPRFSYRLPPLTVLPFNSWKLRPSATRQLPVWTPLLEAVSVEPGRPEAHERLGQALKWYLEFQQVEADARQYAFTRDDDSISGDYVTLVLEDERDEDRIHRSALLTLYAQNENRRPAFGDFFETLEDRGFSGLIRWRPDAGWQPDMRSEIQGTGDSVQRLGPHRIRIRSTGEYSVPARGWVEPKEDAPSRISLERQRRAYADLMERPALLGTLTRPRSLVRPGEAWEGADGEIRLPKRTENALEGDGSKTCLRQMLDCWPFFALQGPPGTGKTTIAARAIRATLAADPSLRILVSAQSHYALDNLASSIMRILPVEPKLLGVRIASPATEEKVDKEVEPLLPEKLSRYVLDEIKTLCTERLREDRGDSERVRDVIQQWIGAVERSELEIRDRIRWGANLIFATCAAAGSDDVDMPGPAAPYDWVVIEEAAKAWPTELAMPLVKGARWALLGDHRQLPAYRRREVEAILRECADSPEQELKQHGQRADEYVQFFSLFSSFFPRVAATDIAPPGTERLTLPVGSLDLQFRMAKKIGDMISDAFYDGVLETHPSTARGHGIQEPPAFRGESLVWLDTEREPDFHEEGCWYNAGEVHVIKHLLARLGPLSGLVTPARRAERLAILTPYRAQVELLRTSLPIEYHPHVHTVDSFQGREAQIVIISLVRGHGRESSDPKERIGYLAYPERVNVMLSRAQRLLVIVGHLRHFKGTGRLMDPPGSSGLNRSFWTIVSEHVERARVLHTYGMFPPYVDEGTE